MNPFPSDSAGGFEWSQPGAFSRSYELRAGDSVVGTLDFQSAFGSLAVARTASGSWTFKRTGFFSPRITARVEGAADDVAIYEPAFSRTKGVLHLAQGEVLMVRSANFWQTEWTLLDSAENILLEFHNRGVFHHGARVEVSGAARHRRDLPVLMALFWYILVLYMEESASSAGAIAAIG